MRIFNLARHKHTPAQHLKLVETQQQSGMMSPTHAHGEQIPDPCASFQPTRAPRCG